MLQENILKKISYCRLPNTWRGILPTRVTENPPISVV